MIHQHRISKLIFQNNKILLHTSLLSIKKKKKSNNQKSQNKKILWEALKNINKFID